MNKYSVILPVRNGGDYVKECVNSILAQTRQDFNLIVLDNNSSDNTLQWIASLHDNRIVIYPAATDLSIVDNWARIKEVDKNEFMTCIGHDDILLPHYLEEMDRLISKHPTASLYQAHYAFIDSKGLFTGYCKPMDEVQYGHEFLACQLAQTMNSMGTGYMMRSADFDRLGGMPVAYPQLIFADYQLWMELTLLNYKATSDQVCFNYRVHSSVSHLTNGQQYSDAFEQYVYFIAGLCKQHEKVKQVVDKYAHDFLLYFCESLAHRLLKTPVRLRKMKAAAFIEKCKSYAALLIPGQEFNPSDKFRIGIAATIDSNPLTRGGFYYFKKIFK